MTANGEGADCKTVEQELNEAAMMLDPIFTKYCELQHQCQTDFEFSIENAERMENCPWTMMVLY